MKLIAHRGRIGTWPENAIPSIESAMLLTSGVEVDVRLSVDGVPVLMHDADVSRTTDGRGLVDALSVSQLTWLRLGYNAAIPRLTDYLEAVAHYRDATVILDLKDATTACIDAVLRALAGPTAPARVLVASRQDQALAELRARSSSVSLAALGVTNETLDERLSVAERQGVEVLFLRHGDDGYLEHRAVVASIQAAGFCAGASMIQRRSTIRLAEQDGCCLALVDLPAGDQPAASTSDPSADPTAH